MDPQAQFDALFDQQDTYAGDAIVEALLTSNPTAYHAIGSDSRHVTKIFQVELDTGITAFFKLLNGVPGAIAHRYGHTRVSATLSEIAAWRVARALGGPFELLVPPTVVRFFDEFDANAPGALSAYRPGIDSTPAPFSEAAEQVSAAAMFDALIGQQDRHGGNFLWDAQSARLSLIDHGFSFARNIDLSNATEFVDYRWRIGAMRLSAVERTALETVRDSTDVFGLQSWMEPDRLTALQGRAERMLAAESILPPGSF